MNFTYKIENYYPYESRVFVVYTPDDTEKDPMGGWVTIAPEDTQEQIVSKVISHAPLARWNMPMSTVAEGLTGFEGSGSIEPPPEPSPLPPPTPEQVQEEIVRAVQRRLNDFARSRNYDNILSACSYVTSTVPQFAAEAAYCVEARDATWATLYAGLADVQAGNRPMPTLEEILLELPVLTWPS